jgi:hypothetical protein
LNGIHQLLVYVDDVILLVNNIDTMKKYTETSIDASKEVGLEVNKEKTKYTSLSCHQNAGQNHDMKTANRCFENVAQFKHLRMTVTNQKVIQEEIKGEMNLGNASYHSVQKLSPSRLLYENVKTRIYNTIILPVVLYGCETLSLSLREERRLRVFENRMLR